MAPVTPPPPWRLELLGLIDAVEVRCENMILLWCDGEWTLGTCGVDQRFYFQPFRALPACATRAEARRVVCEWLHEHNHVLFNEVD